MQPDRKRARPPQEPTGKRGKVCKGRKTTPNEVKAEFEESGKEEAVQVAKKSEKNRGDYDKAFDADSAVATTTTLCICSAFTCLLYSVEWRLPHPESVISTHVIAGRHMHEECITSKHIPCHVLCPFPMASNGWFVFVSMPTWRTKFTTFLSAPAFLAAYVILLGPSWFVATEGVPCQFDNQFGYSSAQSSQLFVRMQH